MMNFPQHLSTLLAEFRPFALQQAVVFGNHFTKSEQTVAEFIAEIEQTARLLSQQQNADYAQIYAEKLLRQFDSLKQAVRKLPKTAEKPIFHSNYHFPKNVHTLPAERRLAEYRKALRALNEKMSWLVEQRLRTENVQEIAQFEAQLQETEYRKQKCLVAIEELADQIAYKR